MLCMYVHTVAYFKAETSLGGICMQQWYEFTTTKGAAGLSMYISITATVKGAEL